MPNKGKNIIQTIFGVPIPPRKKFKPDRCLTLRFVLTGTIPSKKNNYVPDRNTKKLKKLLKPGAILTPDLIKAILDVKPYIRRADRFKNWEEMAGPVITEQAAKWKESYSAHGLQYPITKCSISYYHYWAENKARDNSNKKESIDDLLVSRGIIASDAHQCMRKGDEEADVYHGEITNHITVITLVAYDW